MIRILHVLIGSMNTGGIENMLMQMYRHIDRNRIQFDFVVHDPGKNIFEDEITELGGKLYRVSWISKSPVRHINEFRLLLKNHPEYRVIHIHTTYAIMLTDAMEAKKQNRIVIIHSHNSSAKFSHVIIQRLFMNKFSACADYHVACSETAAQWMFPDKFLKKYIFWPNALPVEQFKYNQETRDRIRTEMKVSNRVVLGNVGRLSYQKNQNLLLQIFSKYLCTNPDSILWLVGDGEDRDSLELKAQELGISNNVYFMGNRKDVSDLLSAMDVLVMTSRYEGLSVSCLEAETNGLPIVCPSYFSKEIDVTRGISRVSNVNDFDEWISLISKAIFSTNREEQFLTMRKSNFNIETWIKKVEGFYLQLAGENK